jgi:NAD(P)-dependent dehydrogenase (short-subunit alcohol dehydrogenase family)
MRPAGGAIVNVASQLASLGGVNRASYAASKAGVVQLTRALATEWAPHAIRVNAVAPGPVRTPMTQSRLADPETARPLLARIPMGRVAEPQEVADAIDFLLSPASAYITGAVLPVDGGYTAA